jgi:hypothetical protein
VIEKTPFLNRDMVRSPDTLLPGGALP